MGPSRPEYLLPSLYLGGDTPFHDPDSALHEGRCPACNVRMQPSGKQKSCDPDARKWGKRTFTKKGSELNIEYRANLQERGILT